MKKPNLLCGMIAVFFGVLLSWGLGSTSSALELDWSGQFWSEHNFIQNYTMGTPVATDTGGYSVVAAEREAASFQSLFLRLRPKVIVNDNIYIRSEWWIGDPVFGMFGNAVPYTLDQRQFYSSFSRGAPISAQRFWGEFVTDIGTVQVGRVPLHWGLGVVWNGGDDLWSRYMSTGDAIRWIAKFGSFSFIPSFILQTVGNTMGGACKGTGPACTPEAGTGAVTDYSVILKYENLEDEMEGGLNVIKRQGGTNQDTAGGLLTPGSGTTLSSGPLNYITYDFYAKKRMGNLTVGGEVPIVTGSLGSGTFQTFGIAGEVDYKVTESLNLGLRGGYAPGQPSLNKSTVDQFRAFYFNPNYHIGMIMFNYQLANFSGPQTLNNPSLAEGSLKSPYDNPITNATYASVSAQYRPWDKWTFRPGFVYARALQGASSDPQLPYFYNTNSRTVQRNNSGKTQGLNLGWELDLGVTFQWDEFFQLHLDGGVYSPGSFFAFSNTANDNPTSLVYAVSAKVGVNF